MTYCIIEVAFVIPMGVKDISAEARTHLIDLLICHSVLQEVRVPVVLPVPQVGIETLSNPLVSKELVYLLLRFL